MASKKNKPTYRLEKQDVNGFGLITQCHGRPPDPELVRMQWGAGEYRIRELNPETQRWRQYDTYIISGDANEPDRASNPPTHHSEHAASDALLQRLDTTAAQLQYLNERQKTLQHQVDVHSEDIIERLAAIERALNHKASPEQQMRDAFSLVKTVGDHFGAAAKNPPNGDSSKQGDMRGFWGQLYSFAQQVISAPPLTQLPTPSSTAAPRKTQPRPSAKPAAARTRPQAPRHQTGPYASPPPAEHHTAHHPPGQWGQQQHGAQLQHPPRWGAQPQWGHQPLQQPPWAQQQQTPYGASRPEPHVVYQAPTPPWQLYQAPYQAKSPGYPEPYIEQPQPQYRPPVQQQAAHPNPPPIPTEDLAGEPHTGDTIPTCEDTDLRLHPTLPGMTPEIEDELLEYSNTLGISWEQGISQAKANGLDAPQLLAFAQSQMPRHGEASHAAH